MQKHPVNLILKTITVKFEDDAGLYCHLPKNHCDCAAFCQDLAYSKTNLGAKVRDNAAKQSTKSLKSTFIGLQLNFEAKSRLQISEQ